MMNGEGSTSTDEGSATCPDLLTQFDIVLDSDPPIDEVGFIHPSQFGLLDQTATSIHSSEFWKGEGKLGISTDVIIPLYKATREAFFAAARDLKSVKSCPEKAEEEEEGMEREVMRRSKAILVLSSDFATAWNARKWIVAKKQNIPMFIDELVLSALVLSYSPKSEQAWSHRRWVIKMIAGKCPTLPEILAKESDLVEKMAERSKMNYRAWNHRCWLVSYMTREQVLYELEKSRSWAGLHVADNSCFHYRTALTQLQRLLMRTFVDPGQREEEISSDHNDGVHQILKEELDWNEGLIKRYVGREALWLYRRFLSLTLMQHFTTNLIDDQLKSSMDAKAKLFLENELHLVDSCLTVPDDEFEDFQAQALYSAIYMLWLIKHDSRPRSIEFQQIMTAGSLNRLLYKECPERSSLWEIILGNQQSEGLQSGNKTH